ncbi:MAG: hypothetical protein A2042_01770 [Candidatus Schekmanbacteria bacterium GWA2_38_11]|uniref:Uncharacterized protein n=1 Tax=Candidatus Schekmanbacteria bacterium GWA2_38_11 TaxID=1817876 RepID=A0A1F7RBW6_9BACT|nr:MAG: hypothetical protein A2042_01770 [Candidatus Schekmanbacteria bacterium GWA2_38_11]
MVIGYSNFRKTYISLFYIVKKQKPRSFLRFLKVVGVVVPDHLLVGFTTLVQARHRGRALQFIYHTETPGTPLTGIKVWLKFLERLKSR